MPLAPQQIADRLLQLAAAHPGIVLPPPCFTSMQGEFLAYEEGEWLSARFPLLESYRNPMGTMQAGFVLAALDNAMGPLTYLIAPPSVGRDFMVRFVRPVAIELDYIYCTARLVERTRKQLFVTAEARSAAGKTLARCDASCQIL